MKKPSLSCRPTTTLFRVSIILFSCTRCRFTNPYVEIASTGRILLAKEKANTKINSRNVTNIRQPLVRKMDGK